MAHFGLLGD